MKLRNKLIPLISAASAAATIAPIALTSCSAGMVNLLGGYRPTIAKAVWEDYKSNKNDMLAFYMSAVNENPEIFAQDMYWKYATEAYYRLDGYWAYTREAKITNIQAKASDIVIRKLTCDYKDGETTKSVDYYTLSANFTFKKTVEGIVDDYTEGSETEEYNISVKNIPVTINKIHTAVNSDTIIPDEIKQLEETEYAGYYYVVKYMYEDNLERSFTKGFLPTDWVIQVDSEINFKFENNTLTGTLDHSAFTNLEKNGYDWFIKMNGVYTQNITEFDTKEPTITKQNINYELNKDSQFVKAQEAFDEYLKTYNEPESLELSFAQLMYQWYLPSFYLSDIVDTQNQLWKEAE